MNRPPTRASWTTDIGARMRCHWLLKLIGVTGYTWLFFIAYFHLLRQPVFPVTVMPLTALDGLIPFQPGALYAYVSLWLYVGLAPGWLLSLRELIIYGLWISGVCLTGLACFYFWPTAVPPVATDIAAHPGFALLKGVDAGGNACPSMHVAAAMFSAVWIAHLLRQMGAPAWCRWLNMLWFAAIVYSTLAIKQHVVLDAIAGMLLGLAFALPSVHGRPRPRQSAPAVAGLGRR
jgi:hypothetical protein